MLKIESSPGAYVASSGELLLRFVYSLDRWRHELAIRRPGGEQILLSSDEGAPDDAIPPSPAFQELRCETINQDTCEFQLFGQAGKVVFSAAVQFDAASGTIAFDVAASANRAGAEIREGSAYAAQPTVSTLQTDAGLTFGVPGNGVGILLTSRSRMMIAHNQHTTLMIRQHESDESSVLRTARNARWEYAFRLVPLP